MSRTHSIINRLAHQHTPQPHKHHLPPELTRFTRRNKKSLAEVWQSIPLRRKTKVITNPKKVKSEPKLEALTGTPTNNMGSGNIETFDPVMGKMQRRKKKRVNDGGKN